MAGAGLGRISENGRIVNSPEPKSVTTLKIIGCKTDQH